MLKAYPSRIKLSIHTELQIQLECIKLGVQFEEVEDIDQIYYGGRLFSKGVVILREVDIMLLNILRRCGYVTLCMIQNCECGINIANGRTEGQSIDIMRNVVRIGGSTFSKDGNYMSGEEKKSGFGYYVRDIILKVIQILRNNGYDKEIEFHGCESESVVYTYKNKQIIGKYKLYGLPNLEEDEFVKYEGEEEDIALPEKFGLPGKAYIFKSVIKECKLEYIKIHRNESYEMYKEKYPNKFDGNNGFKYSTYIHFKTFFEKIFEEPTTIKDIDVNLRHFLKMDGMEFCEWPKYGRNLITIIWDQDYIKLNTKVNEYAKIRGFRTKWLIVNREFLKLKESIKKVDVHVVVEGNSILLGYINNYSKVVITKNELYNEFEIREFRSCLVRAFIREQNMYESETDNMKIALFSSSNIENLKFDYVGILKRWAKEGIKFIFMYPSLESSINLLRGKGVIKGSLIKKYVMKTKDGVPDITTKINEKDAWYDFFVVNSTFMDVCDYISIKDLEVIAYQGRYKPFSDINVDWYSKLMYVWGVATNLFEWSGFQGVLNSSSLLIKSIANRIQDNFKLDGKYLHRLRNEELELKYKLNLEFIGSDGVHWCVSRFKKNGKWVYIDASGHMINVILLSNYTIVNMYGYARQIEWNAKNLD